jgi:drug/metabolite transporter (DMT)-like permease
VRQPRLAADSGRPASLPFLAERSTAGRGAALMVLSMAVFALVGLAARAASRDMGPSQLAAIRFGFGVAGIAALAALGKVDVRPNNLRLLVLRGILGGSAVLLYFVAIERCQDAGTATLLNYLSPIFTSFFAWFFLGERPSGRLGVGVALAAAGVALVLQRPGIGFHLGVGEVAGLLSAVIAGFAVVTIRASRAYDNATTILLAFSLGGLLLSLPFAIPTWRSAGPGAWSLAIAVGVTSFVAQWLMTYAFGLVTASHGALFQQLTPVFTYLLGAALLGEPLAATAAAGVALAVGAVAFAAVPSR